MSGDAIELVYLARGPGPAPQRMNVSKKKVLVTGAQGHIGKMFTRRYADRYQLRLMDRQEISEVPSGAQAIMADITDTDAVMAGMDGIDAVVHLAGDPSPRASWDSVLANNIGGTRTVFEAARQQGVKRVVYASSSHTCAEHVLEFGAVGPSAPIRPDSIYGVSKVFGEALARYYSDKHGLSAICLRIGGCHGSDEVEAQRQMLTRMLSSDHAFPYKAWQNVSIWISNRDVAQLIYRSIEADIQFGIFYGASDNQPAVLDISEAKRRLGYTPEDSAQAMLGSSFGPDSGVSGDAPASSVTIG